MLSESLMGWLTENPGEARILILESSGLSRGLERSRNAVLDSLAARFDAALQGAGVKGKDREAAARCFLGAALESGRHWLQASDQERESGRAAASRLARVQAARVG